jgi:membrane-bound ClpP family serine protease
MLMITIISAIMLIGFLLVILEIFFIPGTTLVGLLGLVFSIAGIVITYSYYGSEVGLIVLISSSVLKLGVLVYSLSVKPWMRFAHKQAITSKVNEELLASISVGDKGKTLSVLRPMGKALINNTELEVRSIGIYLESNIEVQVTSVNLNQIIVEPTN